MRLVIFRCLFLVFVFVLFFVLFQFQFFLYFIVFYRFRITKGVGMHSYPDLTFNFLKIFSIDQALGFMFDQFLQVPSIFIFYFPLISHRGCLLMGVVRLLLRKPVHGTKWVTCWTVPRVLYVSDRFYRFEKVGTTQLLPNATIFVPNLVSMRCQQQ